MEKDSNSKETSKKKCIACKSIIDPEASLCSICSSYQQNWKNVLKYWVNMAGIATIIISLITYLWSAIPKTFFEDSVEILSFDDNWITILNRGFGQVYLSHVAIESEYPSIGIGILRQIAKPLSVGEIERLKIKPFKDAPKGTSFGFVGDCSDEEWKRYYGRSINKKDHCFYPGFYLKNGDTLVKLKSKQKNIRIFEGKGTLSFYSNRSRKFFKKTFELSGIVFKNKSKDCIGSSKFNNHP